MEDLPEKQTRRKYAKFTKVTQVSLEPEMFEQLTELADADGVSFSALARAAFADLLKRRGVK